MSINQNFPEVSPSLLLDFANSRTLDPRITFERSSIGTYVASNGLIKTAAADEPRFDHDPETGESLGLLIEESRTNLIARSNFSAGWGLYYATLSPNNSIISPDGGTNAYKITEDSTPGVFHFIDYIITLGALPYTFSAWLKAAERTEGSIFLTQGGNNGARFNLSNGTIISVSGTGNTASIKDYGNGWYKCSVTNNGSADLNNSVRIGPNNGAIAAYDGDGSSGIYVWGAQLEQGSFPTSYIPTSGSQFTREPDIANITGTNFTNIFNTSEGTFVAECDRGNDGTEGNAIGAMRRSADTYYDMIQFGEFYDNGGFVGRIYAGNGSNQSAEAAIGATHTTGQGIYNRYAFTYKTDDVAGAINGIIQGTDNSASLPTQLDRFLFGNYNNSRTNNNLDGHIKYLHYYPQRLTNTQLQNLTK